jgi:NAD(P)-dependent dehydrogenase (short-subunit alcohol dehydrogenase family)
VTYLSRFSLAGKIALVTGGARGIGGATCDALAEAGAHVIVADLRADAAAAKAAELQAAGGSAEGMALDVTSVPSVTAAHAAVMVRHGRLDVLVNNAGISRSFINAEDLSDDDWLSVLDVNLNGLFWCCRAFGRSMIAAQSGVIVNIGSMSADIVNRPQAQAQYNASKAAVHHLTRSLAAEWAHHGIRVNAVAPTYIATEMTSSAAGEADVRKVWIENTPMGRMGRPDEIAAVVLFLASPASSLMTGSIVAADAGYTVW